ncbi:MAG: hypothetical protein RR053_07885, partial [Evtepia sp.]
MEAAILDLRKNMKKIMSAIERNERFVPTRRRRKMAVIMPIREHEAEKKKVADLPAFGMWADCPEMRNVSAYVRELRK